MADVQLQDGEEIVFETKPGSWLLLGLYICTLGIYAFWRRAKHFALTDHRVILAKGIISKSQRSLPLDMVQDASVSTVLGTGGVKVSTAGGTGGELNLTPMKSGDARKMAERIIQARNQKRSAATPSTTAQTASVSSSDRLRELQRLHDEGLLSDEEYQAKRTQALEGL